MTDNTQPEALRLAEQYDYGDPVAHSNTWKVAVCNELRRQHARIAELEAQLEAIGAGGVSGPLIGQAQAMPDLSALTERGAKAWTGVDAQGLREGRWYMVTHDGVATLCEDRRDAEKEAIQEAEIDLHRLQHIESAALLALGLLWMTDRDNDKVQAAFKTLRNAIGGQNALRKGIESAIDAGYEADHPPGADWWAGKQGANHD